MLTSSDTQIVFDKKPISKETSLEIVTICRKRRHTSYIKLIYLTSCTLTDKELNVLADCFTLHDNRIEEVSFADNMIEIEGISPFIQNLTHKNCHIRHLNLSNNAIQDKGALAIAKALRNGSKIEQLSISGNYITETGRSALAIASFLSCLSPASCSGFDVNEDISFTKWRSSIIEDERVREALLDKRKLLDLKPSRRLLVSFLLKRYNEERTLPFIPEVVADFEASAMSYIHQIENFEVDPTMKQVVVVFGEPGAGKTSIIQCLEMQNTSKLTTTKIDKTSTKLLEIHRFTPSLGLRPNKDQIPFECVFFDTSVNSSAMSFLSALGGIALVVFDLITFYNCPHSMTFQKLIYDHVHRIGLINPKARIVLVGNKSEEFDKTKEIYVKLQEMWKSHTRKVAENGIPFPECFFVSCTTTSNLDKLSGYLSECTIKYGFKTSMAHVALLIELQRKEGPIVQLSDLERTNLENDFLDNLQACGDIFWFKDAEVCPPQQFIFPRVQFLVDLVKPFVQPGLVEEGILKQFMSSHYSDEQINSAITKLERSHFIDIRIVRKCFPIWRDCSEDCFWSLIRLITKFNIVVPIIDENILFLNYFVGGQILDCSTEVYSQDSGRRTLINRIWGISSCYPSRLIETLCIKLHQEHKTYQKWYSLSASKLFIRIYPLNPIHSTTDIDLTLDWKSSDVIGKLELTVTSGDMDQAWELTNPVIALVTNFFKSAGDAGSSEISYCDVIYPLKPDIHFQLHELEKANRAENDYVHSNNREIIPLFDLLGPTPRIQFADPALVLPEDIRYDIFITFHGSDVLSQLIKMRSVVIDQNRATGSDARLSRILKLEKSIVAGVQMSVFTDDAELIRHHRGDIQQLQFAIKCTSGGIGLVLLSPDYFKSPCCSKEFLWLFEAWKVGLLDLCILVIGQSVDLAIEQIKTAFPDKTIELRIVMEEFSDMPEMDDNFEENLAIKIASKLKNRQASWNYLVIGANRLETMTTFCYEISQELRSRNLVSDFLNFRNAKSFDEIVVTNLTPGKYEEFAQCVKDFSSMPNVQNDKLKRMACNVLLKLQDHVKSMKDS